MVRDARRAVSIPPAVLASREPLAASQRVRLPRRQAPAEASFRAVAPRRK